MEPTTAETGWIRARNGSAGQIQNTLPVAFNLRFPGQQFDEETGLHYNHHRYYDPYLTVGYTEADPLGLSAGWNRFAYVDGDPLGAVDLNGLHKRDKWYGFNDRKFHRWFHRCWKRSGNPDADKEEMAEAHALWLSIGSPDDDKCDGSPPPSPEPSELCGEACEKTTTVIITGGSAYIIYRCIRMLPSLFPAFWPSIPANAAIP